jgi:Spx/MgsR family transcriptional regulator
LARTVTLFGIPNCDQIKRSRAWLDKHGVAYNFHDFKRAGLDPQALDSWLTAAGPERLVNRKGTTWRKFSDAERAQADTTAGARALMVANHSLIKRPVLDIDGSIIVGFDADDYKKLFA